MISDIRAMFCDADSVAATAGTWTNVGDTIPRITTLNTLADLGAGQPVYLVILISTGIVAAGAGTVTFRLASDATTTLHATTSTVHWTSAALTTQASTPAAGVVAGTVVAKVTLPIEATYEAHLGIQVLGTTENLSSGNIDAFLTTDVNAWRSYANATDPA